jgi:hypothetical protein
MVFCSFSTLDRLKGYQNGYPSGVDHFIEWLEIEQSGVACLAGKSHLTV